MTSGGLEAVDLTLEYDGGGYLVRPLDGLSLEVEDGLLAVVLGPSGCGKTTLLSCLAGLLTPTSGVIRFAGQDVTALRGAALTNYRRNTVGVVFQAFNLVRSLTARENVMAPLLLSGVRRRVARRRADELLEHLDLSERARHRPGDLSGGQQQRVAIGRALVNDVPLLLADEPTAHLDHVQVEGILQLLRSLATPGRVVVVTTHDERVTRIADRVVELVPRASEGLPDQRAVAFAAGDVIFHQGAPSDFVYVIEEGEVELLRVKPDHALELLAKIGPPSYFGELGPMFALPRSATARAHTAVRLMAYSPTEFGPRFLKGAAQ